MGNSKRHSNSTAVDADSGDQWLLEITSQKLHLWVTITAVAVFVIHIFMGIMVDFGDTSASMTTIDQLAFPTIGLTIAGVILLLTRARIRVSTRGAEVRNLFNKKFYPQVDIYGLSSSKKSRWVCLKLPDLELVSMLATQSADDNRVVKDIRRSRESENKFMPKD